MQDIISHVSNKDSRSLKWCDLMGPEKLKIFDQIDIPHLLLRIPNATKVQEIWNSFLGIYNILRSTNSLTK